MRVVFRTDGSVNIGSGHVVRCLTLADSLGARAAEVLFVCRMHDGNLCDTIEERGYAVIRLPKPRIKTRAEATSPYRAWLGASWQADAEQTRNAIEDWGISPEWIVIDHYEIDRRWEAALRPSVQRIMVIDDLANRTHDCDLLLDQNLAPEMRTRYTDKVPAACRMLLGPRYALLQPLYGQLSRRLPRREGPIRRIFVFFGGVDSPNLTGRTLDAILGLERPDIEIDLVVGGNSPHASTIREQARGHANIHLHHRLPTLAPLMAKADLAIGGGGAVTWERACLGLPSLVVVLAENQADIVEMVAARGATISLGWHEIVTEERIAESITNLLGDCDALRVISERAVGLFDGLSPAGTESVVLAMEDTTNGRF